MAAYDATVMPLQPWGDDGEANVWITGEGMNFTLLLPLRNKKTSTDPHTIEKSEYNKGLIRINLDHLPTTPTKKMKVEMTSLDKISHDDWPEGGVVFV